MATIKFKKGVALVTKLEVGDQVVLTSDTTECLRGPEPLAGDTGTRKRIPAHAPHYVAPGDDPYLCFDVAWSKFGKVYTVVSERDIAAVDSAEAWLFRQLSTIGGA